MKKAQSGFTLIELVMVIVILGVLAAVALPKFVDLKLDAEKATAQGIAGAGASASAINYAQNQIKGTTLVTDCGDIEGLLAGSSLPTGYTIASGPSPCTVTSPGSQTATFKLTSGT